MMKQVAIALLLVLSLLSGCKERIPPTNTDAYDRLHGIINDGKTVNQITLFSENYGNHPKLRFPSTVRVDVETYGSHDSKPVPIRIGMANTASIDLTVNQEHKLVPLIKKYSDSIQIRYSASDGPRKSGGDVDRLEEIEKRSIKTTEMPEWGLREYAMGDPKTGDISRYEYLPLDESFRSVDGVRMWFSCNGGASRPDHCMNRFNFSDGLSIVYVYEPNLLPYWRQIHKDVIEFTKSVLVQEAK